MIHSFECHACRGRYFDVDANGTPYAHVCGPLPPAKKKPQGERPNKRDENVDVDQRSRIRGIKSEGAGVHCLTDTKLEEPPWISRLYKRIADQEEKENA